MPTTAFRNALVLTVLCSWLSAQARGQATFYVSPGGKDTWPGKLDAPNAEQTDGPFATLARAREAVREMKKTGLPAGGVRVVLR